MRLRALQPTLAAVAVAHGFVLTSVILLLMCCAESIPAADPGAAVLLLRQEHLRRRVARRRAVHQPLHVQLHCNGEQVYASGWVCAVTTLEGYGTVASVSAPTRPPAHSRATVDTVMYPAHSFQRSSKPCLQAHASLRPTSRAWRDSSRRTAAAPPCQPLPAPPQTTRLPHRRAAPGGVPGPAASTFASCRCVVLPKYDEQRARQSLSVRCLLSHVLLVYWPQPIRNGP